MDINNDSYDIIQDGTLYLNDVIYPKNSVEGYLLFTKTENTPKVDHILLALGWYDSDSITDLLKIDLNS